MIYQLGTATPNIETDDGREAAYLEIKSAELATIKAINKGRRTVAAGGLDQAELATVMTRVERLSANKAALSQARNAITELSAGDDWISEPIATVSGIGPLGVAWVPIVIWTIGGATVVASVYMLTTKTDSTRRYAEIASDAFDAFNECRDESKDGNDRAQCGRILGLAGETLPHVTKGIQSQSTATIWIAGAVGLAVVGGLIVFMTAGRR